MQPPIEVERCATISHGVPCAGITASTVIDLLSPQSALCWLAFLPVCNVPERVSAVTHQFMLLGVAVFMLDLLIKGGFTLTGEPW